LEKGYVILSEAEERSTIIDTISDLETPETVPALGRLFAIETDPELKEELIEAVGWGDTTDAAKAMVYAAALPVEQPASVRLAAIDGLSEIDANLALPLLRPLIADPDQEVHDAVLETIRNLEKP
jgi:HEAT repeat protein